MSSSAAARERQFIQIHFSRYTTRRARGLCRRGLGGRSMGAIGSDAKGSSRRLSFAVDGRPRHSRISRSRLADSSSIDGVATREDTCAALNCTIYSSRRLDLARAPAR